MATIIQMIALDRLKPSRANVRKTDARKDIEGLAADIEAHGLLHNLQVVPSGDGFEVIVGGRRLGALKMLAKQKKIPADCAVPCQVRPANDPSLMEIGLAENFARQAMHPADEFEVFRKLTRDGEGPETIAARFGVTPTLVRQRLRLASVSPRLIAAYRRDEMTLDKLMAFTVANDHKQQEGVWRDLPDWSRQRGDGGTIRAALTERHTGADSRLARFVGVEAYEEAGGTVLRDLARTNERPICVA